MKTRNLLKKILRRLLPQFLHERYGLREIDAYEALRNRINPGDLFLDIGAKHGYYSDMAIKAGAKQVYAFEPEEQNADILRRRFNGRVIVYPIAIDDCHGLGTLHIGKQHGWHSLIPSQNSTSVSDIVHKRRLDFYKFKNAVIKIDVEGNEREVLAGAKETMKTAKAVLIELHSKLIGEYSLDLPKTLKWSCVGDNHLLGVRA